MKRLMCFVMAVIISLGVFNVCLADAVDIATLTETEKRNLYDELGRYFFGSAYQTGVDAGLGIYRAGYDIPAGAYVFTFSCEEDKAVYVDVYDADGHQISSHKTSSKGGVIKVNIQEGQYANVMSFYQVAITVNIKPFGSLFGK